MKILYKLWVKIPKVDCNTNKHYVNFYLLIVNNLTECHWIFKAKEM